MKLRNSFLVRRFFILLVVAVILWTALTAVFYSFIAQPVFSKIITRQITTRSNVISSRVAGAEDYDNFVTETVAQSYLMYGNWTFLVDGGGIKLHTKVKLESEETTDLLLQYVLDSHIELMDASAEMTSEVMRVPGINGSLIFVSVPIEFEGARYGSVVTVQPMEEMNASILSLNMALIISSLVVLLIMTVPMLVATFRIARPLQSIRKIAIAFSAGDFAQRADESEEGEIGDLGRAMNQLATQLSQAFSELRVERNRLRQILDGIQEGIIAINCEGIVTHSNTAVWDVFGIKDSDVEGLSPNEFLRTSRLDNFFNQVLEKRETVNVVISKDNRQINVIIAPLETEEHIMDGAVGLFRDITEAERLEMTRRDYIANVSHELRTPLTAMRGLLEPLSEGMVKSEEDRQRYYDILLRETHRLSRLINDMLELSRIQAGEAVIVQKPFEIGRMISDLVFRFQVSAEENDITLELKSEEPLDDIPLLWGNPDRVEQILVILLDNAIKYSDPGGNIKLEVVNEDRIARIIVFNSGTGITPEDVDHVFDRFFKADRAHTQPGTGLGLSIAKELANNMGQKLDVRSDYGKGACFILSVPHADVVLNAEVNKIQEVLSDIEDEVGVEGAQTSVPISDPHENKEPGPIYVTKPNWRSFKTADNAAADESDKADRSYSRAPDDEPKKESDGGQLNNDVEDNNAE